MSRFEIKDTPVEGVKHITRKPIGDERGWLERMFCAQDLIEAGWSKTVVQINRTFSKDKGTVRGMHFQYAPHAECKLVSCLSGAVLDVAIDLREGSPTFLQHYAAELSGKNCESLILPEGVAHGFQTLSENVEMLYFHSEFYAPEHEDSINPEDPALAISWPLEITAISERDKSKAFLPSDFKGFPL